MDSAQPPPLPPSAAQRRHAVTLRPLFIALYVALCMEDIALLAGTTALFVVLAGVIFFTRHVDWFAHEVGRQEAGA